MFASSVCKFRPSTWTSACQLMISRFSSSRNSSCFWPGRCLISLARLGVCIWGCRRKSLSHCQTWPAGAQTCYTAVAQPSQGGYQAACYACESKVSTSMTLKMQVGQRTAALCQLTLYVYQHTERPLRRHQARCCLWAVGWQCARLRSHCCRLWLGFW